MSNPSIDVQSFIDGRKMSAYQLTVFAICVGVLVLDGFDAATLANTAPSLAEELHFSAKELGLLFAASAGGPGVPRPMNRRYDADAKSKTGK